MLRTTSCLLFTRPTITLVGIRNYSSKDPRSRMHPRDPRRKMHPRDPRLNQLNAEKAPVNMNYQQVMHETANKLTEKWGRPDQLNEKERKEMEEEAQTQLHSKRMEMVTQSNQNDDDNYYEVARPFDD